MLNKQEIVMGYSIKHAGEPWSCRAEFSINLTANVNLDIRFGTQEKRDMEKRYTSVSSDLTLRIHAHELLSATNGSRYPEPTENPLVVGVPGMV